MRIGDFGKIFESMFTDLADVHRYQDSDNSDGSTDTKLSEHPIYTDVSCRISFSTDENPKEELVDDVPVINVPKLFFKLGADIRVGDYITVRRFDDDGNVIATYSGKIGLPSVFITHKEALFSIERSA